MVLLARLLLDPLEVVERALARVVEQADLEVLRQLDREDAEVALVVELDGRVPGGTRRLLVRSEQRVLECGDERAALDSLLALDLANGVNDLLAHALVPSSIRLARTISSYGMSIGPPSRRRSAPGPVRSPAETTAP